MIRRNKKIMGAFLGTIVEYYDYNLYGFSAGILAGKFFPNTDKVTGLIYVFAIYAMAYVGKPLGSIVFSHLGDLYGRRLVLQITMFGIALPTLMIGLLPEYSSIGVTGTYILIICRCLQGFFAGGEYDAAAIYVIEHLGGKYHYTASALTRTTGVIGLLMGIGVTNLFNSSIFPSEAWRIPFLLSLPLAFITIYYRQFLEETPDFKQSLERNIEFVKITDFIKNHYYTLMLVSLLAGSFGITYQISIVFMKQYLPIVIPQTSSIMTSFSVIAVLGFGAAMPFAGFLADRFGPEIIIKYSFIFTIIASTVLAGSIYYQIVNLSLGACLLLAIAVAPFNALAHGIIIKTFSVQERYRGISIGHNVGSMLMSGTANFICILAMKKLNFSLFPILYITSFAILIFLIIKPFTSSEKLENLSG